MRTRCWGAYAVAALLGAARASSEVMVDDTDPGIAYSGDWVHNPWGGQTVNFGSSVTFTNASGSTATYSFRGTAIAVYGAFEMSGTFDVHSSYTIDGGPATEFRPADTFVSFQYHQKFFQSDTLSDDEHTLVITNLGVEFWFDYLVVTQAAAQPISEPITTTTTTAGPTTPQPVRTPSASTASATPSASMTNPVPTSSASQPATTQSSSSPSSQTQSTRSFSNTNNVTITSTDSAVPPPSGSVPSSTLQSQTSAFASDIASPTGSITTHAPSSNFSAGAIAGAVVGGLLVLGLIGIIVYRCRRRQQAWRRQSDLTPYDSGQTALASEPSEKRGLQHDRDSDSTSGGSGGTSTLTLPLPAAPDAPYPAGIHSSGTSAEYSVSHENQKTNLTIAAVAAEQMGGGRGDRLTAFESLGSLSSASPLLSRTRTRTDSSAMPCRCRNALDVDIDVEGGKRSLDGGVRLAGGPLEPENARRGDDARSGVSTLPPAYQVYPAA